MPLRSDSAAVIARAGTRTALRVSLSSGAAGAAGENLQASRLSPIAGTCAGGALGKLDDLRPASAAFGGVEREFGVLAGLRGRAAGFSARSRTAEKTRVVAGGERPELLRASKARRESESSAG